MTRLLHDPYAMCGWGPHLQPSKAHLERYHQVRGEWVPVCRTHLTAQPSLLEAVYGDCTWCGRNVRIRKDGTWPRHNQPVPAGATFTKPRPCPTAGMNAISSHPEDTSVQGGGLVAGGNPAGFKVAQTTTGAGASTPTPASASPIRDNGSERPAMQGTAARPRALSTGRA